MTTDGAVLLQRLHRAVNRGQGHRRIEFLRPREYLHRVGMVFGLGNNFENGLALFRDPHPGIAQQGFVVVVQSLVFGHGPWFSR